MIKKSKILAIISMLIVGMMAITGCANSKVAAKVNGEEIKMDEYTNNLNMNKAIYAKQFGKEALDQEVSEGMTLGDFLGQQVLTSLVNEKIILQDAEKKKISVEKKEVEEKVEEFKKNLGGDNEFKEFLKEGQIDQKFFESKMKDAITLDKHKIETEKEYEVSNDEMQDYYEENKEAVDEISASHILIAPETAEDVESEKAALDKATEIYNKIVAANGENFEEFVAESSDEQSKENQGKLGYFKKGKMVAEFEEKAYSMEVGEISEPVKTEFGYHIIRLDGKRDNFEANKEYIAGILKEEKYNEYVTKLIGDAEVELLLEDEKETEAETGTETETETENETTENTDTSNAQE